MAVQIAVPPGQATALAEVLAGAVEGVVQAQRRLDKDALARVTAFIDTPAGGLALPPLWYTLSDVGIELEMSASVARLSATRGAAGAAVRLDARLLNPTAVSLFGFSAASGLRVSLRLSPREAAGAVPPLPVPPAPTPAPTPAPVPPA